jgi:hypothetical protein
MFLEGTGKTVQRFYENERRRKLILSENRILVEGVPPVKKRGV